MVEIWSTLKPNPGVNPDLQGKFWEYSMMYCIICVEYQPLYLGKLGLLYSSRKRYWPPRVSQGKGMVSMKWALLYADI